MRFLAFASILLALLFLANFYIYRRFLRKVSSRYRLLFLLLLVVLMGGEIFFVIDIAFRLVPDRPWVFYLTSACIGVSFILFIVAIIYDLVVTTSSRIPFDQERRKTIKIIFDVTMLVAAIAYLLRGFSQGIRNPGVNRVSVNIRNFQGEFSIVQLTDIHVGRTIKRHFVQYLVDSANALNPDIVVITGDLVDLPIHQIADDLEPLRHIRAPVYFIPGNHEYFHGVHDTIDYLARLGIKPLINTAVTIRRGKTRFNLVGLSDVIGYRIGVLKPDPETAFSSIDRTVPTIVLAHQPKAIEMLDAYPFDLMLSGHTHGGQIFPFGFLVMTNQPYLYGLHRHTVGKQIFVSRGAGYWGPPIRVLAPSEISRIVISST
jgi:predicted MPP superfamily phosphohydrolase